MCKLKFFENIFFVLFLGVVYAQPKLRNRTPNYAVLDPGHTSKEKFEEK